jgi:2-polyprenyl-3-methyl-5-hydroxy-6-metoxy-1,4-benzoquinol methylase
MRRAAAHIRGRVLDFGCGTGQLAGSLAPEHYIGYEIDPGSLAEARERYPDHLFSDRLPSVTEKFDTIVLLAVIEHLPNPYHALQDLRQRLRRGGHIVLTTMTPACRRLHETGAMLGLFSAEAASEHHALLDRNDLHRMACSLGMSLTHYRRFLCAGNQLAVMAPEADRP